MTKEEVAKYIDHTLLKPESTRADIARICEEAKHYGTASVCVNPFWVGFVAEQLKDSDVKACCVIGFPLGATLPSVKAFETDEAIKNGAKESLTDESIDVSVPKIKNFIYLFL